VVEDIEERYDLGARMSEKVADLKRRLDRYLTDVEAGLPTINTAFDPDRDPNPTRRRRVR
jgi:hypothetical protein